MRACVDGFFRVCADRSEYVPLPPSSPVPGKLTPLPFPLSLSLFYLSAGAANLHTTIIGKDGQPQVVSDYATVQGILIGVVAAFILVVTIIGP